MQKIIITLEKDTTFGEFEETLGEDTLEISSKIVSAAYKQATGRVLTSTTRCLDIDCFDFDECILIAGEYSVNDIINTLAEYCADIIANGADY